MCQRDIPANIFVAQKQALNSCAFILQYERHLYYLQEMAPYDEPLRSELLGGKFTILVGGSVSQLVEVCFPIMWWVYKSASDIS